MPTPSQLTNSAQDKGRIAQQILQQRQPGFNGLQPLKQGVNSFALAYQHGEECRVIRIKAGKPDSYRRDKWAWQQLAPRGLPVSKVFEIGTFPGGSYCLSRRCQGLPLREEELAPVLPSLITHLGRLHSSAVVLADGRQQAQRWNPFLRGALRGAPAKWLQQTRAQGIFPDGVYREIQQSLAQHVPLLPASPCLYFLHNDLNRHNLLFCEGELSGLFDWGDAMLGDFLYDATGFVLKAGISVSVPFLEAFYAHYVGLGFDMSDFQARFQSCLAHNALKMLPFYLVSGQHTTYHQALAAFRTSRSWRPSA